MKNSHRGGFTLVELLIVTVLGALTLGVVYETLIVQEKSFAAARGVM
ncbi:MAG: prepilin-type N-terminal cleavage/methylation domain-containing protein, partial [Gemmatimonadota bacterium]